MKRWLLIGWSLLMLMGATVAGAKVTVPITYSQPKTQAHFECVESHKNGPTYTTFDTKQVTKRLEMTERSFYRVKMTCTKNCEGFTNPCTFSARQTYGIKSLKITVEPGNQRADFVFQGTVPGEPDRKRQERCQ